MTTTTLNAAVKVATDASRKAIAASNTAEQAAKAASKFLQDVHTDAGSSEAASTLADAARVAAQAAQTGAEASQSGAFFSAQAAISAQAGAQAAKALAEAARDSVNTTGKVFLSTAAGVAAVADGQTFAVLDASLRYWTIYQRVGAAANAVATSYTSLYIDSFTTDLGVNVAPALVPLMYDDAGNVPVWLVDGKLSAVALSPGLMAAVSSDPILLAAVKTAVAADPVAVAAIGTALLPTLSLTGEFGPDPIYVPLVADTAGNVPVWLDNGNLDARGLGPNINAALSAKVTAMRFAPLNGPVGSALPVSTDGRSLYQWRSKLAKLQTATPAVAKILLTGDSWTEHPYIAGQLSALLYAKYGGKSGEGWINTSGQYVLNGVTFTKSGGWTLYDASNGAAPALGCGIDGMAISTTSAVDTAIIQQLTTTNLDIYYRNGDGTFRYQVDGGAWTAVVGNGSGTIGKVSLAGLSNAVHSVGFDTTGNTGTVVLYGFRASRPAVSGVEFSKAGNGGINGVQLSLWASTYVQQYAADILPDVVVIALGTNDYRQASNPTQYLAALTAYVAATRAASPNTGFVFIAPADTNGVAVTPLIQYRDALYQFCIANGHEFYNMRDEWGDWATMNAQGVMLDALHPNHPGGYLLAKRLHNLLLEL